MAELQVVARAKDRELQVTLDKDEARYLFGTDRLDEQRRVAFYGSVIDGISLYQTEKYVHHVTRGVKPYEVKRGGAKDKWVARMWLPLNALGVIDEYREKMELRAQRGDPARLLIPPLRHNWHSPKAGELIKRAREQIANVVMPPQLLPNGTILVPPTPAPAAAAPPPAPVPHTRQVVTRANGPAAPLGSLGDRAHTPLPLEARGYTAPTTATATTMKIAGDAEQERQAFEHLLEALGRANQLLARAGEVRLEIEQARVGEHMKQRILVNRIYRPGQVQLRDPQQRR